MKIKHLSYAEIDLDRLHKNVDLISSTAGVPLMPVVKANAYGHGATRIAKELTGRSDVAALCVGTVDEALELRKNGVKGRIIVLDGVLKEQAGDVVKLGLEVVISSATTARVLSRAAVKSPVPVHLKINTGMGRLGVCPGDALDTYRKLAGMKKIRISGVMTHLADSDRIRGQARSQINSFNSILDVIASAGFSLPPKHAANTAAVFLHPDSRYDLVRPGIGIYGVQEFAGPDAGLAPILSWRARVTHVRQLKKGEPVSYGMTWVSPGKRKVAVVSVGYADGYSRSLSNRARAIIGGKKMGQIGVICMDNSIFNVTNVDTKPGDVVTLIGKEGQAVIKMTDIARQLGTISYEVMCMIGQRCRRVYIRSGKVDTRLAGDL